MNVIIPMDVVNQMFLFLESRPLGETKTLYDTIYNIVEPQVKQWVVDSAVDVVTPPIIEKNE